MSCIGATDVLWRASGGGREHFFTPATQPFGQIIDCLDNGGTGALPVVYKAARTPERLLLI